MQPKMWTRTAVRGISKIAALLRPTRLADLILCACGVQCKTSRRRLSEAPAILATASGLIGREQELETVRHVISPRAGRQPAASRTGRTRHWQKRPGGSGRQ